MRWIIHLNNFSWYFTDMSDFATISNWWEILSSTNMFCLMLNNVPKSSLEILPNAFSQHDASHFLHSVTLSDFPFGKNKQSFFPVAKTIQLRLNFGFFTNFGIFIRASSLENETFFRTMRFDAKLNFLKGFFCALLLLWMMMKSCVVVYAMIISTIAAN